MTRSKNHFVKLPERVFYENMAHSAPILKIITADKLYKIARTIALMEIRKAVNKLS